MDGRIIFKGKTKENKDYLIRYPKPRDVEIMLSYINTLSSERTFITRQGEQLTFAEEQLFLHDQLEKIEKRQALLLLIEQDHRVIGLANLSLGERVEDHIGSFGLSIAKAFRGQGLGRKLLELLISEATAHIPTLRIIKLSVFANNPVAINLYTGMGFKKYGILPKGLQYRDKHVDNIVMYKTVRE